MKRLIWIGLGIGSTVGGAIPLLWDPNGFFSLSSVLLSTIGGLLGIWAGVKLAKRMGL